VQRPAASSTTSSLLLSPLSPMARFSPYTALFRSGRAASAVAYAAVFLLLGAVYILGIRRLIRKGVYSNPQKPQSTAAAYSGAALDRKSTRLNSSHVSISYAVF